MSKEIRFPNGSVVRFNPIEHATRTRFLLMWRLCASPVGIHEVELAFSNKAPKPFMGDSVEKTREWLLDNDNRRTFNPHGYSVLTPMGNDLNFKYVDGKRVLTDEHFTYSYHPALQLLNECLPQILEYAKDTEWLRVENLSA